MSYYYNYTLGYMLDGKIYPFGPYTADGKLQDIISRSRSFASDLHEDFYCVQEKMISEKLKEQFSYKDWDGETKVQDLKYLRIKSLPSDDFIKKGFFLIEDVKRYEETNDAYELFYEYISPTVYAALLQHETQFGKPEPKTDEEGNEYPVYSASDYMFYMYPDYLSKEYEAFMIRNTAEMLAPEGYGLPEGAELIALETEG